MDADAHLDGLPALCQLSVDGEAGMARAASRALSAWAPSNSAMTASPMYLIDEAASRR
jgi:hypothetical protein